MSDEIKEILDYLRKYIDNEETGEVIESKHTMNLLLDYITNLQEENIKLKELCNKYEEEHKTTFEEWKKDIEANKKAIEYTNQFINFKTSRIDEWENVELVLETIVSLLKGDNK